MGSVAHVIAGWTLTSANYEKSTDLLKKRFGNRQVIISSHMEALTKIPKIMTIHEVKRLCNLYDTVESHVRALESLEISQEMYGSFLTPTTMQKLPEEFRIAISRNLTSETWVLKDILTEFQRELQLRQNCQHVSGDAAKRSLGSRILQGVFHLINHRQLQHCLRKVERTLSRALGVHTAREHIHP